MRFYCRIYFHSCCRTIRFVGKIVCNSCSPVRSGSCVDLVRTQKEVILNASALSENDRSLIVTLSTQIPSSDISDSFKNLVFSSLLDSGSTDCFLDKKFVLKNRISTLQIPLVNLRLFDGSLSSEPISEIVILDIRFDSGIVIPLTFYVTILDSSCKAVLGYSFLSHYNPLIDWVQGTISFQNTDHVDSQTSTSLSGNSGSDVLDTSPNSSKFITSS